MNLSVGDESPDPYRSLLEEQYRRVEHDRDEAVIFLASIIPKEDKARMCLEIAEDPDWEVKQHFCIGMTTRNALRRGGFFYDPIVMDQTWFEILSQAVCLPEEKIILTQPIEERIQRYHKETEEYEEKMKEHQIKNQKSHQSLKGFLSDLLARIKQLIGQKKGRKRKRVALESPTRTSYRSDER